MNQLQSYTLGYAPDGTRCAYLGDAVDARDFIYEGVVYRFTYDWRNCLDVYVGVVKSLDRTGVLFGALDWPHCVGLRAQFGDTVLVEWKQLLKILEEWPHMGEGPTSPWQNCGGRSMRESDFMLKRSFVVKCRRFGKLVLNKIVSIKKSRKLHRRGRLIFPQKLRQSGKKY